jgi:hypothetical protein
MAVNLYLSSRETREMRDISSQDIFIYDLKIFMSITQDLSVC